MSGPDGNTLDPNAMLCPTENDVGAWFKTARGSGHTFEALPGDEARMSKSGSSVHRMVWVETHEGKRVSLAKWL
jgi:hypothetical protein